MTVACGWLAAADATTEEPRVAGSLWVPLMGLTETDVPFRTNASSDAGGPDRIVASGESRQDEDRGASEEMEIAMPGWPGGRTGPANEAFWR